MQFSSSVHMMGLALIYRQEEGGCGCGGCEAATEEHPLFGQMYALVAQRLCPKVRGHPSTTGAAACWLVGNPGVTTRCTHRELQPDAHPGIYNQAHAALPSSFTFPLSPHPEPHT